MTDGGRVWAEVAVVVEDPPVEAEAAAFEVADVMGADVVLVAATVVIVVVIGVGWTLDTSSAQTI